MALPEVLTAKETMSFLRISESTYYELKAKGIFDGLYFNVGKRVLYSKAKLLRWMENGGTESA